MIQTIQAKYFEKKLNESKTFLDLFFFAGPATFLGFWIADYFQFPEFKWEFLAVRLSFCALVFVSYLFFVRKKSYFMNQMIMSIWSVYGSVAICYMMYRTVGPSSMYYSGINLVALFSLIFATLDRMFFISTLICIYLPYYALCAFNFESFSNWQTFFVYNIFNMGTIFGIVMTKIRREKDFSDLLNAEVALETELKSRELVIIKKTEEATKLHQLSSQFSPQIIKAIKQGSIKIDEEVQSAEICAIFIDIVNSTDRVTKLPERDMQLSLARFLDTTLTTFLKYDLTIDKFHGDGILAFSNMPVKRHDYIARTCMAAMEAIQLIKDDSEFYLKHWKSDLQVRVGISAGQANVGFYGDQKYFKTFTAIGIPLPYASRLTSAAEPGQVLVDKNIANVASDAGFVLQDLGRKKLKGFDEYTNSVFCLVSAPRLQMSSSSNEGNASSLNSMNQVCSKHNNSVMFLDTDAKGHYEFKCRDCENEEQAKAS